MIKWIFGIILVITSIFLLLLSGILTIIAYAHWNLDGLKAIEVIPTLFVFYGSTFFIFRKGWALL